VTADRKAAGNSTLLGKPPITPPSSEAEALPLAVTANVKSVSENSTSATPAPSESPASETSTLPYSMATTPAGRLEQRQRYQQARQRMCELQTQHGKQQKKRSKRQRRPVEHLRVSPTEPEAALGFDKLRTFRPLYNVQLICDLDAPFV